MKSCVVCLVVVALAIGLPRLATAADLFEYFLLNNEDDTSIENRQDDDNIRTCECMGPTCMCCVDFNLTYIDLGGPGCVQMKYVSQEEGLKLNVSYGESLLHSQQVKGPNPEATCMALLINIAEICARFSNLLPHDDGLRGCLLLEPKLLGAVTATFKIGCFTMGPKGMVMEKGNSTVVSDETESNVTESSNDQNESSETNNGDLLAVVNETAQQGLAFLGNLLGLAFSEPENESQTASQTSASESLISGNLTQQT